MKISGVCHLCSIKLSFDNSFSLPCGHFLHSCAASQINSTQCPKCKKSSSSSSSSAAVSPTISISPLSSGYSSENHQQDFQFEVSQDLSHFHSFKDFEDAVKKLIHRFTPSNKSFLHQAEDKLYFALSCIIHRRFTLAYRELSQMRGLLAAALQASSASLKTDEEKEKYKKFTELNSTLTKTVENEIQKYFLS